LIEKGITSINLHVNTFSHGSKIIVYQKLLKQRSFSVGFYSTVKVKQFDKSSLHHGRVHSTVLEVSKTHTGVLGHHDVDFIL
jgi:hypothetical protein